MDEDTLVKKRNKAQRDGNVQVLKDVQKKLGDLYYDKKRYEEALEAYKGQLQASECLSDKLNCAIAHRMIGEVYADIGDFTEALNHQNLYLEIAKELKNLVEEQRAFATLGRTYLLIADSLVKESEKSRKMEVLKDAKKTFSKSIKLCDKLENKIDQNELMMMRARLLLNLGLVLEQQKDTEHALNLIQQAASLCRKHNLHEDLHRTNIALAGLNERLGSLELALKNLNDATKVDDIYLKADARLAKAELLLKLGEWMESQKILHNLYRSKKLLEPVKQQVTKLLKIAVLLCRNEDKLLTEDDLAQKEKLYESMGDAATAVRCLDKAAEYYRRMLECAEETNSSQLSAALTSLSQTLRDAGKYKEAIPFARRELDLYSSSQSDAKEASNCALYLASLLIEAGEPDEQVREAFDRALASAKLGGYHSLERSVVKELVDYLHKKDDVDLKEIAELNDRLEALPNTQEIESEEEEEAETPEIGADICLDELSDAEGELVKVTNNHQVKNLCRNTARRTRCVVKRNEKGESLLHIACIKGNTSAVEKLLEEQHPTAVRDHCGWTPLHEAANHGYVEIVQLLVRAGADVNDPGGANCDGVTALHDAAANGHSAIIQLLLDNGANANLLTRGGESALDCLEAWRERVGDLSTTELKEYVLAKRRLSDSTTMKSKKKKNRRENDGARWNALLDDEEDGADFRPKTVDTYMKASKPEKISAGEDYKRTIASLQHPGRQNLPPKPPTIPKITAPLIDSEEMLVEDWLEDDIGLLGRKEKSYFNSNGLPAVTGMTSTTTTKRKSKNDSDSEMADWDGDKSMKRQKIGLGLTAKNVTPIHLNEDSCESSASSEKVFDGFDDFSDWPKKKKKPRQISLLKQGFTKVVRSRSPSPAHSISPEPIFVPATLTRPEHDRRSWDSGAVSEIVDLEILVEKESFELKLHFRDLRKSMSDIEELIRHKFETKTGCRPQIRFKTVSNVILSPEVILEEVPREKNKLKLFGEIIQNDLPSIVDRYKKICEAFSIDITDSMLKSLRSCDNTSTFRLSSEDSAIEELEPLVKCLHYQKNLQILNLSGATFFNCGDLLDHAISELSGLCELHLQCCDVDYECLTKIEKLPLQIRVLDLSYNPLGDKSHKKLYELLEPLKYLQTLNLKSCELNDFKFSYLNSSLVNLDISWNPIGGEGAANFLQRQLLSLNLSNTQTRNRMNVIDKIFFNDSLGFSFFTLESLELSFCQATDLDVEKILSQTPNLTRIILSNNENITRTSLCAILAKKPTMTYIDLSGCQIIDNAPDANLKLISPQICTLFVHMKEEEIDAWESLWQGKGRSRKLPHKLVVFKPI